MDSSLKPEHDRFTSPQSESALGGFMKHAKWAVVVTLVVLSGLAAAQLNSDTRIMSQVPFSFVVADRVVPAGQYVVQAATADGNTLIISNTNARVGLFSSSSRAEDQHPAAHYALVFKHYGDRYFLSAIELQGSKVTYRLTPSKAEAELRAQNVPVTEETLLASLK